MQLFDITILSSCVVEFYYISYFNFINSSDLPDETIVIAAWFERRMYSSKNSSIFDFNATIPYYDFRVRRWIFLHFIKGF